MTTTTEHLYIVPVPDDLVEERLENVAPHVHRCVGAPTKRTERCALAVDLAMEPRTHDEEVLVVAAVLRFDRRGRGPQGPVIASWFIKMTQ